MTKKQAISYIKNLAKNNYEIDAYDTEKLIEQLILEGVISLKVGNQS